MIQGGPPIHAASGVFVRLRGTPEGTPLAISRLVSEPTLYYHFAWISLSGLGRFDIDDGSGHRCPK